MNKLEPPERLLTIRILERYLKSIVPSDVADKQYIKEYEATSGHVNRIIAKLKT